MAHRLDVTRPLALLACAFLATACGSLMHPEYAAEPIEAWVKDEQTGEPLEGVVVVANWLLMDGTVGGRTYVGPLVILEAVTDANGRFHFPAWGPVRNHTAGMLFHEDPLLWFFAPGFGFTGLSNHYAKDHRSKPSRRTSDWNGKSIRLKRFSGDEATYAERLVQVGSSVESNLSWNRHCSIRKTPLLAKAVDQENARLERLGHRKGGFTFRRLTPEFLTRCGITGSGEPVK